MSEVEKIIHFEGTKKETSIRNAFYVLLNDYAKQKGFMLKAYKEKKPSDPTIAEKFNTYRFADYKEQVIDLLKRVCTVSAETMKMVREMEEG
jgi:predicted helicase